MQMVSPNQLMASAKENQLDGREPQSIEDHIKILEFLAVSIESEVALPACRLMVLLFDMPVDEATIERVVNFYNSEQPVI